LKHCVNKGGIKMGSIQEEVEKLAKKGKTVKEIAKKLDISEENVRSRLLKALDRGKIKKLPKDWRW
jgi:DNA-binding NarL/FixJ family response regulator